VARAVGKPGRENCGNCHFYGGGRDGVKHGDLDSSLLKADKALDVHMAAEGLNFSCGKCHVTKAHRISGRCYEKPAFQKHEPALPKDDGERLACESCHGSSPHRRNRILDHHTDKVACQSCHIPTYARGGVSTKVWWDWSTAGKFAEPGKIIVKKDDFGDVIYHSQKGDMLWGREVEPEYRWYNGVMTYFEAEQRLPYGVDRVELNVPEGDYQDPRARIYPFKIMRGRQPFDPENRLLVIPHLYGKKETGAYWGAYDWEQAAAVGMREAGLPFSGRLDFIETGMYWPITHMVTVKEQALGCEACHSRNGRLAGLKGFYLPGRDRWLGLDRAAGIALLLTFLGLALHAGLRFLGSRRQGGRS